MCLCEADLQRAGQYLCLSFVHSAVKMRGQGCMLLSFSPNASCPAWRTAGPRGPSWLGIAALRDPLPLAVWEARARKCLSGGHSAGESGSTELGDAKAASHVPP